MANIPVSKNRKSGDVAAIAKPAATAKAVAPAKKTAAKPKPKPIAKSVAKPVTKAAAKPAAKALTKPAAGKSAKPNNAAPAKAAKNAKPKKSKLVRDSFTMPEAEYGLFAAVKKRCVAKGVAVKKSEVLRAAIIGFAALSDAAVLAAVKALDVIKTGRKPKGHK